MNSVPLTSQRSTRSQSCKPSKIASKLVKYKEEDTEEEGFSDEEEKNSSSGESENSEDTESGIDEEEYEARLLEGINNLEVNWTECESFTKSNNIGNFRSKKSPLKKDLSDLHEPESYFGLILTDEYLLQVCSWTNERYDATRNRKRRESHEKKWEPMTLEKIKAFLSLLILMPLVGKPRLRDYWSHKALTSTPGLRNILSRDEFYQIKKYIAFYDPKSFDKEDAFYRVRPLLDKILANTNAHYNPPQSLSLDESMIPFKGRCKFRVYMPLKPVRFGFKCFTVTPSDEPIVLNLEIYDGKSQDMISLVGGMLQQFEKKGHVVYMDRFYSSAKVFTYLEQKGIGAVGTCLHNRLQIPEEIKTKVDALERNQFLYYSSDHLFLSFWKDSKLVTVLSTVHNVKQVRVIRRKKKRDMIPGAKSTETILMPQAISEYNTKARGVDVYDQYTSYQMLSHRTVRWYFRIIVFLLEAAAINSWVLYKNQQIQIENSRFLDYSEFRRRIGKKMAHGAPSKEIPITPIKAERKHPIEEGIDLWGDCHLGKAKAKKQCSRCLAHMTRYVCDECEIPLCLIPCYDLHRIKADNTHKVFIVEKK